MSQENYAHQTAASYLRKSTLRLFVLLVYMCAHHVSSQPLPILSTNQVQGQIMINQTNCKVYAAIDYSGNNFLTHVSIAIYCDQTYFTMLR